MVSVLKPTVHPVMKEGQRLQYIWQATLSFSSDENKPTAPQEARTTEKAVFGLSRSLNSEFPCHLLLLVLVEVPACTRERQLVYESTVTSRWKFKLKCRESTSDFKHKKKSCRPSFSRGVHLKEKGKGKLLTYVLRKHQIHECFF